MYTPPLGLLKRDIDTPSLCVDLEAMERNIRFVATFCRRHGVAWRPHSKGHKSTIVAQKLVDAGAIGATCAKLGEAEVMAAAGIRDLLIANTLAGPAKVARLVELRRIADPIVCIDHLDQALPISLAMQAAGLRLRVVIELDVGMHRAGVLPGQPALALARGLHELPGLELSGVMGWEGHLLMIAEQDKKKQEIDSALGGLIATRDLLLEHGLPCPIVSGGGTGSYLYTAPHPGLTEIQAGGIIFMDAFYRHKCHIADLEQALTIAVTVVSRPAPDRAIIDAGRKTMNQELHLPLVQGRHDIRIRALSAEHGILELDSSAQDLKIGDQLQIIPGYCDLTVMLHEAFYAFRQDRLEAIWPIEARGKLR